MASPVATATAVVDMARDGRFTEIEALFGAPLRAVVSAETLRVAWTAEMARTGPVSLVGEPAAEPAGSGLVRVSVPVTCARGSLTVIMSVDEAGLVQGLRLAQATTAEWAPPKYATARRFTETDLGTTTVTLPRRPRVGVVLLSGGGPFDRDATSGANKPFKDLAWGLATRRIAVARFDKPAGAATVTEEYVPRALAAVRSLREHVDRIVVLGHSMGGKVAPRVVAADPAIAGMVLLAADAQPMHEAAVRVTRHLADDPATVDAIVRQAALVDSPDLSPATSADRLPFGYPATYWLDLRDYDPVAAAAALHKPMLILQGGRDYQVTVADDLSRWRALSDRPDVTIRVYAADNHLFFPGTGPSTPAEYTAPQHVDPAVVRDIADWLHRM